MKKYYVTFVALAVAALATSCSSDDVVTEQQQDTIDSNAVMLTASVNEGQTRVGMTKNTDSNTASFYWHKDDKILVQTVNNGSYSGAEFSIKDDEAKKNGATSATFTGMVTGTVGKYAVYPYDSSNQKHEFSGEKGLSYVLPNKYTYNKVESNIFSKDGSYPSNPTNMPMLGTISNNSIKFKCIGGLAVIRIDRMPATSGTVTVTADQQLSGSFTISDLSTTTPELKTTSESVSDENKKVEFAFSGATKEAVGVFYLPLAPGTYSNVKVTVGYDGTSQTFNHGSLTISRATATAIALTMDYEFSLSDCRIIWAASGNNETAGTWDTSAHKFYAGTNSGMGWEWTTDKPNLKNYHYLIVEIDSDSQVSDTNYAFRIHNGGFWDSDKSFSLVYDFDSTSHQCKIDLTQTYTYTKDNTENNLDLSKTTCIDFWGMCTDTSKYVIVKRVYATNQAIE